MQTFTKFGELPPELRIKIWQMAMPDARTIVVKSPFTSETRIDATSTDDKPAYKSLDGALPQLDYEQTWKSNATIPALLHVNAEARHEALKHYKLSLGIGKAKPRIYVDFNKDTLFFGHSELKSPCSPLWASTSDLDKVKRLAIVPEGAFRVLRWKKVDLNCLEKMIFVHDTENLQFGPSPQLVEDLEQDEMDEVVDRVEHAQVQPEAEAAATVIEITEEDVVRQTEKEYPLKKRMEEAREELDTLMVVLPTHWEKEPVVSTAVFRMSSGDRKLC